MDEHIFLKLQRPSATAILKYTYHWEDPEMRKPFIWFRCVHAAFQCSLVAMR
jgi:hypothetical protein